MSKLVITEFPVQDNGCTLCARVEEERVSEIFLSPSERAEVFGNIYVGKVEKALPYIHGAFVEIEGGQSCFYNLAEEEQAFYVGKKPSEDGRHQLKVGDRMLVQVSKEQMRGKRPTVTSQFVLTGRFLVFVAANSYLRLSRKLSSSDRARLKGILEEVGEPEAVGGYGIIVRTNACMATAQEIFRELGILKKRLRKILAKSHTLEPGSLVEKAQPFYLSAIHSAFTGELVEIVTDVPEIYEEIKSYLREYQPENLNKLRLYKDARLPLYRLYALEHVLNGIQKKRVWLKSGGFLVIEQTEAFVSIDVNTGGYVSRKEAQETYRKINLEAAREIAFQLRLRNLSGAILVDFINLRQEEDQKELMYVFQEFLKKDPVKTEVVDMTALKIVEVTRQKIRRSVPEELQILTERKRT